MFFCEQKIFEKKKKITKKTKIFSNNNSKSFEKKQKNSFQPIRANMPLQVIVYFFLRYPKNLQIEMERRTLYKIGGSCDQYYSVPLELIGDWSLQDNLVIEDVFLTSIVKFISSNPQIVNINENYAIGLSIGSSEINILSGIINSISVTVTDETRSILELRSSVISGASFTGR